MNIVFVSMALNIHQIGVSDELYRLTGGKFCFIETGYGTKGVQKGGESEFASRSFLIKVKNSSTSQKSVALQIIRDADMMIFGAAPIEYLKERVKTGKLTFVYSERWFKRGILNLLSPRLLQQQWFYHIHCHGKPVYALCASAYAAGDFAKMFSFKNKCFKWGYFTSVSELDIENIQKSKRCVSTVKILWVARFLQWKHPERMLQLASLLRNRDVDFSINMIGVGPEYDKIGSAIQTMGLENYVHLLGRVSNNEVMEAMRTHDIFCFTSDKNEGWGAVLNEAMSSGCCPVSSIETGSTPYLIKDGINGLSFDLKKEDDLFEKVLWLIEHPEEREKMSIEAYKTMRDVWSPKNAATQLVKLCKIMQSGDGALVADGPCSRAL